MRNAIPREAEAVVLIPDGKTGEVDDYLHEQLPVLLTEYAVTDPRLYVGMRACKEPASCMPEEDALRCLRALLVSPEGVERMSDQMPGLVETSNNTAIIGTENGNFTIRTLMRSSVDSAKEALAEKMRAVIELAGGTVEFTGGYSGFRLDGWEVFGHSLGRTEKYYIILPVNHISFMKASPLYRFYRPLYLTGFSINSQLAWLTGCIIPLTIT